MRIMDIYNRMPVFVQNIAVSAEGYRIQKRRYGSLFESQYEEYMSRNCLTYKEKCEYRDLKIHHMISHCYHTVPYYRKIMRDRNLKPDDFHSLEDLKKLPIIDKHIVKENFDDFFSNKYDRKDLIKLQTSGSTGAGFIFYENKVADAAVWAHVWRGNHNLGLNRNMWCAYFGGKAVIPPGKKNPPFYRVNCPGKQIMFSIYHLSPENMKFYISSLDRFKTPWIQGYPSALSVIAEYMVTNKIRLKYKPEVITISSESASKNQIRMIEQAFGVYPIQNYAQSEGVATFRQRLDQTMIVDEDFAAVEFVPEQGEVCRIVGTTLTNYAMPFLRYDTKDLATWRKTEDGREILSLEGRLEDEILFPDGRRVKRMSRIFQEQLHIVEAQVIQKKDYSLVIRILKDNKYSIEDEQKLRIDIEKYLLGTIDYKLEYVEKIPRHSNGKMKFIISEL